MGYDLHWIDGPDPGDARDEYDRRAHFEASEPLMAALRQEMERQRMIGNEPGALGVSVWDAKLAASGQVVTRIELAGVMPLATDHVAPPPDDLHMSMDDWRACWHQWLDFLVGALNYGGFRVERT